MPVAKRSIIPNLKNISDIILFLETEILPSKYSCSVIPIGSPPGDTISILSSYISIERNRIRDGITQKIPQ